MASLLFNRRGAFLHTPSLTYSLPAHFVPCVRDSSGMPQRVWIGGGVGIRADSPTRRGTPQKGLKGEGFKG